MDIRFKIDPDRLTLNDSIAMEEAALLTSRGLRDLLARHMVDAEGNWLETKAAQEIAGSLTKAQQVEALDAFRAAIEEAGRQMLPLAKGAL